MENGKERSKHRRFFAVFIFALLTCIVITVPFFIIAAIDPHHDSHESGGSDEISVEGLVGLLADAQKVAVSKDSGAIIGTRAELNFIEGSNITLTITDDAVNGEVDIEIEATGGGGGAPVDATYVVFEADATLTQEKILGTQVIVDGLDANIPLAGVEGRLYWATDTKKFYRDNGAGWDFILSLDHALLSNLTTGDPHTQYQLEVQKGVANGYASLDALGDVPDAQISSLITRDAEWNTEGEVEAIWGKDIFTDTDGSLDDDDVTLGDVQDACTNDFHSIGGTDDDIPDANDWTEGNLESSLSDASDVYTDNDGALSDDDLSDNSIEDLNDVTAMAPDDNDVLTWNTAESYWEAQAATGGASVLSDLTDVGATAYTTGKVLRADGDSYEEAQLAHSDLNNDETPIHLGVDTVKDSHIDWGSGADQVDADDIGDGSTNAIITLVQEGHFDDAYTHVGGTGADHTWIDQGVTSGSAPTFTADNFSDGGGNAIITTTQETNFEAAYTHSGDSTQAHTDYLINTDGDTQTVVDTDTIFDLTSDGDFIIKDNGTAFFTLTDAGKVDINAPATLDKSVDWAQISTTTTDGTYGTYWQRDWLPTSDPSGIWTLVGHHFGLDAQRDLVGGGGPMEVYMFQALVLKADNHTDLAAGTYTGAHQTYTQGLYGWAKDYGGDVSNQTNKRYISGLDFVTGYTGTINNADCDLTVYNRGVFVNASTNPVITDGTFTAYTYGAYLQGSGTTEGTQYAYGVWANATGADTNYSGYFVGDVYLGGKVDLVGIVDPPAVLYDYETRESIIERVMYEVPPEKLDGAVVFYNGDVGRLEMFIPSVGEFRSLNGILIEKVDPIKETFKVQIMYRFDTDTGEVVSYQAPVKSEWQIKEGVMFDNATGKFYEVTEEGVKTDKEVDTTDAIEYREADDTGITPVEPKP